VAVIGLGAGTLAAYGRPGDQFVFYEINSQVVDMARALFFYLRETRASERVTIGDGRLSLEHDPAPPFDVIVLDAFSGDAIPVHLLTREAVALYLHHLLSGGVLAFHISNDFLDLAPVVQKLAKDAGYRAVLAHNKADVGEGILAADWVLVTNNQAVLDNASIKIHQKQIEEHSSWRLWTDDYNNVWETFKAPELRR
jgi:spermidine synthase